MIGVSSAALRQFVSQHAFMRGMATLAGGTAVSQVLGIIAFPLLTRLYLPEDFGKYGLFTTFTGFAAVALTLRYEVAIVTGADEKEATVLTSASIVLSLLVSLIASTVFCGLIAYDVLGFGSLPVWAACLAWPILALSGGTSALRYLLVREGQFGLISRVAVCQNGVRALSQLLGGLAQTGWVVLATGELLSRVAAFLEIWRSRSVNWRIVQSNLTWSNLNLLRRHYRFPLYSLPSSLLDTLAASLPLPIVAQLYGQTTAGYMLLAQRVAGLPLGLVGESAGDAFYSRFAELVRTDPGEAAAFFRQTALSLFLLSLPLLVLMPLGPILFGIVFGSSWVPAGTLISVMTPWVLAQLAVSPLSRVVFVLNGQGVKLVYDFLAMFTSVVALFGGNAFGFGWLESVALLSGLQVATYVVYFLILLRLVRRLESR